jgi:hypothetical protein
MRPELLEFRLEELGLITGYTLLVENQDLRYVIIMYLYLVSRA